MIRRGRRFSLVEIFAAPTIVALLTIVGLVAALLGDGVWDAASWVGLGVPVFVTAWVLRYRRA